MRGTWSPVTRSSKVQAAKLVAAIAFLAAPVQANDGWYGYTITYVNPGISVEGLAVTDIGFWGYEVAADAYLTGTQYPGSDRAVNWGMAAAYIARPIGNYDAQGMLQADHQVYLEWWYTLEQTQEPWYYDDPNDPPPGGGGGGGGGCPPLPAPQIAGINPRPTSPTVGYIELYGTDLNPTTDMSISGTSFVGITYQSPGQVNLYYEGATEGSHDVTITKCGTISNVRQFLTGNIIQISGPQSVLDGNEGSFSVTVVNGSASGYQWSFSPTSGVGNNPQVNFSSPTSASTTAPAHWFADPNNACTANPTSTYTINAHVSFNNDPAKDVSTTFTAQANLVVGGQLVMSTLTFTGGVAVSQIGASWRVIGMGTMTRNLPSLVVNYPPASQFYTKLLGHEQVHLNQISSGYWLPNDVLNNHLMPLIAPSQQELQTQINSAFNTWFLAEGARWNNDLPMNEAAAFQYSDPITPQYLYQNCGRY